MGRNGPIGRVGDAKPIPILDDGFSVTGLFFVLEMRNIIVIQAKQRAAGRILAVVVFVTCSEKRLSAL